MRYVSYGLSEQIKRNKDWRCPAPGCNFKGTFDEVCEHKEKIIRESRLQEIKHVGRHPQPIANNKKIDVGKAEAEKEFGIKVVEE